MEKYIENLNAIMQKAYSPYSKVKVGALLVFENGDIIDGCNIENSSYGLTICAERVAIFKAISMGLDLKKIKEIYVKSNDNLLFTPCGACRQVLNEFLSPETVVKVVSSNDKIYKFTLSELLPYSFSFKDE